MVSATGYRIYKKNCKRNRSITTSKKAGLFAVFLWFVFFYFILFLLSIGRCNRILTIIGYDKINLKNIYIYGETMIKIMPQALSRWLGAGNLSLDIYICVWWRHNGGGPILKIFSFFSFVIIFWYKPNDHLNLKLKWKTSLVLFLFEVGIFTLLRWKQ